MGIVAPLSILVRVKDFTFFYCLKPVSVSKFSIGEPSPTTHQVLKTSPKHYQGPPFLHRPVMTSPTEISNDIISGSALLRSILPFSGSLQLQHTCLRL